MHFFSSCLMIAAATSSVLAHRPLSATSNVHARLHEKRQTSGQVYVTGANGMGDNQIHPRLEISDMATSQPEQFSLLILAMSEWQSQSMNLSTSYYGVSGIHGVPLESWDGVDQCESCGDAYGYCTHVSILFPAWHRAYVALYEQELLTTVFQVANSWTGSNKDAILAAANTMRLPYWDWAAQPDAGTDVLPAMLSSPQISINGSDGQQQTVSNPLYTYHIPDDSAMAYDPFMTWPDTLRYPNTNAANAISEEASAINALNNIQPNMQESVYGLLTNCKDYNHFSHDGATGSTSCANSLEGIHNTIHTTTGGPNSAISGGHMTYLPLAAFDPIFWFHHANVDRIFALWQTVNPDSYGGSQVAVATTWTIATGSTQDADSPLTPFRNSGDTFWTTNMVKDWANTFKYTYPEFTTSDGSQSAIANYINQLYGSNPTLTASSISKLTKNAQSGNKPSVQEPSSSHTTGSLMTSSRSTSSQTSSSSGITSAAAQPTRVGLPHLGFNMTIGGAGIGFSMGLGPAEPRSSSGSHSTATSPSTDSLSVGTVSSTALASAETGYTPANSKSSSQNEYACSIRTPRFAYNVSYTVYVFDGEPTTQDNSQWVGDKNCVGSLGILAGGMKMNTNIIASGSVPLTRHLQGQVDNGALASMSEQDVTPYLKQNLNWKIVSQGVEVHPTELPNYKAAVFSGTSSSNGVNALPEYSAWQPQIEATKGKAGGCQSTEETQNEWPVNSAVSYSPASSTAAAVPASTPVSYAPMSSSSSESCPPGSSSSAAAYALAPYPTGSTPVMYSPSGGYAAPTGTSGTTYVPSYTPSTSPIASYTGSGTRLSGNALVGIVLCAFASVMML